MRQQMQPPRIGANLSHIEGVGGHQDSQESRYLSEEGCIYESTCWRLGNASPGLGSKGPSKPRWGVGKGKKSTGNYAVDQNIHRQGSMLRELSARTGTFSGGVMY